MDRVSQACKWRSHCSVVAAVGVSLYVVVFLSCVLFLKPCCTGTIRSPVFESYLIPARHLAATIHLSAVVVFCMPFKYKHISICRTPLIAVSLSQRVALFSTHFTMKLERFFRNCPPRSIARFAFVAALTLAWFFFLSGELNTADRNFDFTFLAASLAA